MPPTGRWRNSLLERGAKPAPAGGEPALVAAASITDDDPTGVALLLKHRAAVNALDARQRHALLGAAAEGHERIARALCDAGADVEQADKHGSTALMEAARAGASGIVQRLAEAKVNALARDQHGRDALMLACQSPHADATTIHALLELGADAKAAGSDGRSALDHASAAGRWDLVALLDPDTALPTSLSHDLLDEGADTPQHLLDALRFGHWATVSAFGERVRTWPQAELARLYLELATPGLGAARRWLLDHGLAAEARLEAPRIDEPDTDEAHTLTPLGRRLFDALLDRLPDATEAVDDLLQAGASPAGGGLLAVALVQLQGAAQAAALPLGPLSAGATGALRRCRNARCATPTCPPPRPWVHWPRCSVCWNWASPSTPVTSRAPPPCCAPAAPVIVRWPPACSMPAPTRACPRTAASPPWSPRSPRAAKRWWPCCCSVAPPSTSGCRAMPPP
ncbi:hypothetical protein RLIN73S_02679 [Rhodanobacter lindaniclasticus]